MCWSPAHSTDWSGHSIVRCHCGTVIEKPSLNNTCVYTRYNILCLCIRHQCLCRGAGRSSEVERSLMVRWVVGSILHGVDPLSYFSFQPVLRINKGRGMYYPVCGMVHIKEPLLLIDKRVSFLTIRMVLNHMSDAI